jgi:Arc/MetJ family transcription regulator
MISRMRTTIELDADTAKAVERLRREEGLGMSEAVNLLIRRGLMVAPARPPFRPIHRDLGITIDVSNVADALDLLEGAEAR